MLHGFPGLHVVPGMRAVCISWEVHLPKTRKEKQAELTEMSEDLRASQVVILTEYRGLTVSDISRLRGQLRDKGTKFSVAKNTLMALALKENGQAVPEDLLTGPTAFAFVRDDIPTSARLLNQFAIETRILTVKGAIVGDSILKGDEVKQLQDLPTRDQSRAQLVGVVSGPLSGIVSVLNAPLREIAYVIQQRADQLGAAAS